MVATLFILFFFPFLKGSYSTTFTIVNKCSHTVWPGILSSAGTLPFSATGFALQPGESNAFMIPAAWSGSLWGRTLCSHDSTTGKFSCITGDCGSSTVECASGSAAPPATLAEFTLNGSGELDFFDVSLVHGYNLPMTVVPYGGTGAGNCSATGCVVDLNAVCPTELMVKSDGGERVACNSACEAFGDPKYCCSGASSTHDSCKPSPYSQFFKSACPRARTYPLDQAMFTCASADYLITFCPSTASTNGMKPSPRNVKDPMVGDNSGGHADGWSVNKFIVVAVTLASVFVFFGCKLTGCGRRLVCNMELELERVTSSESSIPQPATV